MFKPQQALPLQHSLLSTATTAEAIISLIQRLGWSHIGVITVGNYHDSYYIVLVETFVELAKRSMSIHINLTRELPFVQNHVARSKLLYDLKQAGVRIVVSFLPPRTASEMICCASQKGFIWPKYVWIYGDIDPGTDLHLSNTSCGNINVTLALENVIFLHRHPLDTKVDCSNRLCGEDIIGDDASQSNSYARIIYDSVWALALARNASLMTKSNSDRQSENTQIVDRLEEISFQGESGFVNFNQSPSVVQESVTLLQFQQGSQPSI